ncbi:import inner membrane translocase subunit TIM8 [Penicillium odoratum]|uniref:import inner membrane translocase subunit TIM8 n=1 Tax=Penicillium odoratum TaxID=1167516 RepID=UPI002546BD00|nr:import inner membrane translocase subunit TIM8 [Penicillium odoratum]KAJ5765578.1 import inner membrane translocase subunit TIM8 [Penicillium odoratum]
MDQQIDISKLNEADKKELNQILVNEQQKSNIQQMVHQLNDVCWKKCITGKISSNTLNKTEEACAQNCVDRWMDTQVGILKHLEAMRH